MNEISFKSELLQYGIGICSDCGKVMSTDDCFCTYCGTEKFFITHDNVK